MKYSKKRLKIKRSKIKRSRNKRNKFNSARLNRSKKPKRYFGGEMSNTEQLKNECKITVTDWPGNYGCGENVEEKIYNVKVGDKFDRFGYPKGGYYLGSVGSTFLERSLPRIKGDSKCESVYNEEIKSGELKYTVYEALKPFRLKTCDIASFFGVIGGGVQYRTYEDSLDDNSNINLKTDIPTQDANKTISGAVPNIGELVDEGYLKIVEPSPNAPMFAPVSPLN